MKKLGGICQLAFGATLVIGLVVGAAGCTRVFYRQSADREVYDVLAEKDKYAIWKIEQFHVYPDARSRYSMTASFLVPYLSMMHSMRYR